jgi:hypothetical protein
MLIMQRWITAVRRVDIMIWGNKTDIGGQQERQQMTKVIYICGNKGDPRADKFDTERGELRKCKRKGRATKGDDRITATPTEG